MAHKIIAQIVFTGARVFGRAFAAGWQQANARQRIAQHGGSAARGGKTFASSGITLDEACKILNVPPPKGGQIDMEHVMTRFKTMFDQNAADKGGSFYLQSKILRARERIEMEVLEASEKEAARKEAEEGWNPKVYKDR